MNKSRICIECHHIIVLPTPKQKLCEKCRKAHAVAAHKRKTNTTTRGNSVATVTLKLVGAAEIKRLKRKVNLNFSDIMHAPADKAANLIDQILAGKMSVTG